MKRTRMIQERERRSKKRSEVAIELGISEVYVRKIESGMSKPGRDTMLKFSKYYGLGLKTLFPDIFDEANDKKLINAKESIHQPEGVHP